MRRREFRVASTVDRLGRAIQLGGPAGWRPHVPNSIATGPAYFFSPTGSDSNSGLGPDRPKQTCAALITLLAAATPGGWTRPLSGLSSQADFDNWVAGYQAGTQRLTGGSVFISGPFPVTGQIVLPSGWEIMSADGMHAQTLSVNVPVSGSEVWTQPNAGTYANVWGTTGTIYQWTFLYEASNLPPGTWVQQYPVQAATLALALPLLQARPGSFYVDPATNKVYTQTYNSDDPNGGDLQYVPAWAATLQGPVVRADNGRAYLLKVEGGAGGDPTQNPVLAHGASGFGHQEGGGISVADTCTGARNGSHSFAWTGSLLTGLRVARNCTATQGPGGVFVGNWSHYVDYTSGSGAGSIRLYTVNCGTVEGWANVDGTSGGTDAVPSYQAYISHTGDATLAFAKHTLTGGTWNGYVSVGVNLAAVASTAAAYNAGFATDALTSAISTGSIGYRLPVLGGNVTGGTHTLTGVAITPTTYGGSPPSNVGLSGTVTWSGCTIDLTGASATAAAYGRAGAYALTLTGCTVKTIANAAHAFIDTFTQGTDTISVTGTAYTGQPWHQLILNYNGTGQTFALQDAFTKGWIDGTCTMNGVAFSSWVPTTDTHLSLWVEAAYSDVNGATDSGALATVTARYPATFNITRSAAGPTWSAAHKAIVFDGSHWMVLPSNIVIPPSTPFTLYEYGFYGTTSNHVALSNKDGGATFLGVYVDLNAYFLSDSGSFVRQTYTGPSAQRVLMRWRRDAANAVYYQSTGMAEVLLGTLSDLGTFNTIGYRNQSNIIESGSNTHDFLGLTLSDVVAAGTAASWEAYIANNFAGAGL